MKGQIERATLVLGGAHALQVVASLANVWLLTRALGPGKYGELSTAVAGWALLGSFTDLGTGVVAVRAMAAEPERAPKVLVALLRLRFVLAAVATLVGVASFGVASNLVGLAGAAFPIVQAWSGSRTLLQARVEPLKQSRALVLGRVAQVGLVLLATKLRPEPELGILALLSGELLTASLLRREVGPLPRMALHDTSEEIRRILAGAAPLAAAFVVSQLAANADVVIVRTLRSADEAGLFALARKPLSVLEPVPRLLLWSAFAIASAKGAQGDLEGLAFVHRRALAWLALLGAVVAGGAALVGREVLGVVFGADFAPAGGAFVVLGTAAALGFLVAEGESMLVALGSPLVVFAGQAGGFLLSLGVSLVLVPRWGFPGAAVAGLAGSASTALFFQGILLVRLR